MSDSSSQGEPTMEEILASIRRIISEDSTEEQEGAEEGGEESAEESAEGADSEAAEEAAGAEADEVPEETPEAEPEEAGGEVLDLTQMVGEDGSVVDLAKERETVAAGEAEATPSEEDGELEVDLQEVEPEAEASPPVDEESLLSDPTKTAALSSFVQLADAAGAADGSGRSLLGGGLTLEELVRDALEPYLKSWLDENLATLVERIVREEIQKLVKRAEYR